MGRGQNPNGCFRSGDDGSQFCQFVAFAYDGATQSSRPKSSGSTDSVKICGNILGDIHLNDEIDVLSINPSGSHVGSNHNFTLVLAKFQQGL